MSLNKDDRPLYEQTSERMRTIRAQIANRLAAQIIDTCSPFLSKPIADADVLDCGSGYGQTALILGKFSRSVKAIEPSRALHEYALAAQRDIGQWNVEFVNIGVEELNDTECFDLAILDNVLEHIGNQREALRRLNNALRRQGVLFVIVPNKLWPIEVHYGLPFLSYLPLSIANLYLRITRRGIDYSDACHAPTYWKVRHLLRETGFADHYFVVPGNLANTMKGAVWYYRLGAVLLRKLPCLWAISKAFVIVAIKHS